LELVPTGQPTLMGDLAAGARMLDELADNLIASFEHVEERLRRRAPAPGRRIDRKA